MSDGQGVTRGGAGTAVGRGGGRGGDLRPRGDAPDPDMANPCRPRRPPAFLLSFSSLLSAAAEGLAALAAASARAAAEPGGGARRGFACRVVNISSSARS